MRKNSNEVPSLRVPIVIGTKQSAAIKQIASFLAMTITIILSANNLFAQAPYFQQEVNYKIQVKLDDVNHTLDANETIVYKNNSPDELKELWFHIWPNAYSDRNTALAKQKLENGSTKLYFATEEEKGFIDSLKFNVDGTTVKWELHPEWKDVCKLILNESLKPNSSIIISTPFHVKIPSAEFSRLGHTGQAYYVTQWYPKPAVYDNKGWHAMPFLDQGEFYSEYGSFDVSITLPKNYVVGATGDLVDGENELQWLNKNADTTKTITEFSKDMSFPKSESEFKTLTYKQTNVHDFAWFADKRFHVLKGEVETPHTHNKVTTWTMFTNNEAKLWMNSIEYMNDAIYYYSLWNGDYPYKQCTAIDGTIAAGGGMEYPNITIIGESRNAFTLEDVIVHEVGHNWFYGLLGSNERNHGWMDEGINSFNEMRYVMTKYPPEKFGNKNIFQGFSSLGKLTGIDEMSFKDAENLEYRITAAINADQPINITSEKFMYVNYGTIMYSKTALVFDYLKNYLGDSLFDKCMQRYFDEWHYKHPYPDDLRKIFEETSGKGLDWFFNDLINTNKKIDYSICKEKKSGDDYTLTLSNCSEVNSPLMISAMKENKVVTSKWIDGFEKQQEVTLRCDSCDHFQIDPGNTIPEIRRNNNYLRTKGLFKKMEPISLNLLGHFDFPQRTRINFAPAIGWNEYNKWMAGIALYNKFIPEKKFEYVFVPMYGFGDKDIAGLANISYSIFPNEGLFDRVSLSTDMKRFAYYNDEYLNSESVFTKEPLHYMRVNPELKFSFRKSNPRSLVRQQIFVSSVYVNEEYIKYLPGIIAANKLTTQNRTTYRASYNYKNSRVLDPYNFTISAEGNGDYLKAWLEASYTISYPRSKRGVNFHLFAGGFGFDDTGSQYAFRLSNWGPDNIFPADAWYDELYLGRRESEHFISKQMTNHDGGFKIDVPYGKSSKWMTALNINIDFPGSLPLGLFADVGTFENANKIAESLDAKNHLLFDGGIWAGFSFLKIYFPLLKSQDIKHYQENNPTGKIKFGDQIRFVFDLKQLNPFNLRKRITN